jgi:hypothetical protein
MKRIQTSLTRVRNLRQAGKVILALAALLLLTSVVLASGTPSVDWWVIGGGGGHAESAPYALDGTVGQPVVGVVSDDPYELCSGFWCRGAGAGAGAEYKIYLPIILRNYP